MVEDHQIIFTGSERGNDQQNVGEGFAEKWGYFGIMYRLTNGNIKDLDKITKLNLLEAFTWLSYETDLAQNKSVQINGNK